jgi:glycosyltransferase involved in cell wall biosynthesis
VRIGVDATCWTNRRGYGRHLRSLLGAALALDRSHHYVLFVDSEPAAEMPAGVEVRRVRASTPAVEAARSDGRRSLADLWSMSRALAAPELDCLLFPTVYSYVPVFSRAYKIVVIHDVIPEKFPEHVFPTAAGRMYWNLKSLAARRQADLILTVSEFSRRGLIEHFGEPADRIRVVGEAPDAAFRVLDHPKLSERLGGLGLSPEQRLLVFVGGFSPHKNLLPLLDVFAALEGSDLRLVLVGDYEKDAFQSCYQEVKERIARPPLEGRVIATGFVPDDELAALLNLATALVLPSQMEGFGLPAIEAAACGLAVVATISSPLPELLGAGALYVDPQDPQSLRWALERVLADPALREQLRRDGLRAASALTWSGAARQLLAVFDQVAHRHAQAA